jgi:ATP-dependent RNA helicase SUPV3L1/SUV3
MATVGHSSRVQAVLGPTNTGKTHLAIERMIGHASGMIGFPLRLLARENYDRIVRLKGRSAVALITGEEKIIPPRPQWFVCTVESMPLDRPVEFLAVDEVQLAGDPDRGHVFTDRILHARGTHETMFLGADSVRPLLRKLAPEAEIVTRPRFSNLSYTGARKVTRLPPRTAVVAFSVADVFALAELVRRQRGGTAVVLGALSPRARNAQVAMYQAGEVDFMVATDAIGMGLNMDLDHVAFARLVKFDGRGPRRLTAAEIAQIAGRAGRHMNDGTFGTTDEAEDLEPEIVEAIEAHRFDPLAQLWWRNSHLDFRSGASLWRSLERPPPYPFLTRAAEADDQIALQALLRQPEIARRAANPSATRLLWDVCQIPDFRKIMSEHHARLLGQIYQYLSSAQGRLPDDWVTAQIARLDRSDGEIDTLVQRIAHIRTWTYIAHRPGWMGDAGAWQERTRAIEDRLSDALHDRITQRFVDKRSTILVKHLQNSRDLAAVVAADGTVRVEGQYIGDMKGLRFVADGGAVGDEAKLLLTAANRLLRDEVVGRARQLLTAEDTAFVLEDDGGILWQGTVVARLAPGEHALAPRLDLTEVAFLEGEMREQTRRRLTRFVRDRVACGLRPLGTVAPSLGAAGRGLMFRLSEGLGTVKRSADDLDAALPPEDRRLLARLGVRFGAETIYLEPLLKPAAVALRALLWSVCRGLPLPAALPPPGRISIAADWPESFALAIGYRRAGGRVIRIDRLERLATALRERIPAGPMRLDGPLAALVGSPLSELPAIVVSLGYRENVVNGEQVFIAARRLTAPRPRKQPRSARGRSGEDHPFAALRKLEILP